MAMIELREVTREFNGLQALKGLSFTVRAGEIFGFIGPNGAGKTTTMRILATLLQPTTGDARINGYSVTLQSQIVKQFIGFMPDFFGIYDGLTVEEFLFFFAGAFRLPRSRRAEAVSEVLELTDMGGKRKVAVETLSTGMRQRLCLAKTLLHDPLVLLLDEPAAGLDPRGRIELRELLKTLRDLGKTIFISSHILPELADFCDRIGIIEEGRVIYAGYVEEALQGGKKSRQIRIKHLGDSSIAVKALSGIPGIGELEESEVQGNSSEGSGGEGAGGTAAGGVSVRVVTFQFAGELEDLAELVAILVSRGVKMVGLEEEAMDLEDLFLSVTKGGIS